jgi:hypothetical protein
VRRRSLSAAVLLFASCFAPQQDVPVQTCAKCPEGTSGGGRSSGAATGGNAAGSSTGGMGNSSGGTAGGGSSSGTSSGGSTGGPVDAGPPTGTVCPPGSIMFGGGIQDLCQSLALHGRVPLGGVQVDTLPFWGAAVSDDDGGYTICMKPSTNTTLWYRKAAYIDSYSAEFNLNTGTPLFPIEGDNAMVCQTAISSYETQLPQLNPSLGAVFALWTPISDTPPCGGELDGGDAGLVSGLSGWTFVGSPAAGGSAPDGGWPVGYFDYSGVLQSSGMTFATGEALIYNIDPSVGYIKISATKPGYTQQCPLLNTNGLGGFTGRVIVTPNAYAFFPYGVGLP